MIYVVFIDNKYTVVIYDNGYDGVQDNMKAVLITRHKSVEADGSIIEFVVWQLPVPVPPTTHGFKYRMVYLQNGARVVGFDNERGKGDHVHLDGKEYSYQFTTLEQLISEFMAEIEKRRRT